MGYPTAASPETPAKADFNDHPSLWMNPLYPIEERLDIARGAIAWRDSALAKARLEIAALKRELRGKKQEAWLIGGPQASMVTLDKTKVEGLIKNLATTYADKTDDYTVTKVDVRIIIPESSKIPALFK